jgi:hypothetical protein
LLALFGIVVPRSRDIDPCLVDDSVEIDDVFARSRFQCLHDQLAYTLDIVTLGFGKASAFEPR